MRVPGVFPFDFNHDKCYYYKINFLRGENDSVPDYVGLFD